MRDKVGDCSLTGKEGKFVDAHILPKALTRPAIRGEALYQSTKGKGYKKRFSSWYDKSLVIREGEDILARIDNKGIKLLRQNMLIWSSWIVYKPHFDMLSPALSQHSIRQAELVEPEFLHLFFLSLAWRACASQMPDMRHAKLDDERLELLRQVVSAEKPVQPTFFPVALTQITTKGEVHNYSPTTDVVTPPDFITSELPERSWEIVRIYLDGLVAHVHLDPFKEAAIDNSIFLGSTRQTSITGVTYEESFQYENLLINAWETHSPFGTFEPT